MELLRFKWVFRLTNRQLALHRTQTLVELVYYTGAHGAQA